MNTRQLTRIGAVLAANLLIATAASAANFYVNKSATCGSTCDGTTWAKAWTSLGSIKYSALNPGDTVYIAGGTYGSFSVGKSGTASAPLTFKRATQGDHGSDTGWSSAMDARIIIDGGGSNFAIGIGEAPAYAAQSNIVIDGATRYGIWARNAMYGVRAAYGANKLTLRYLEIGDPGAYKNGEDGIQGKGDDLLVEYSYIHDNDSPVTHGDGIQWFGGNRVTLQYNIWKNNGQQIYLGEGNWDTVVNDVNVRYNVIYNRGGGHYNGIVLYGNNTQSGRYLNFYNNTFDLESKSNDGFNSIFYPIRGNATINFKNNAVSYANASNVQYTADSSNAYDNSGTYVTWNIPSSETGRVTAADLGFVDQANANYRLAAGSPLIGKGVNVGLTRDFDGKAVGSTPSIGAFEYGTGSTGGTGGGTVATLQPPTNLTVK